MHKGSGQNGHQPNPYHIVLIYTLVGGFWILLSDRLLSLAASSPSALIQLQTVKGWFYVLGTAWMLYLLIRRYVREVERSREEIKKLNEDLERRVQERTAELEEANQQLETFSYSISHDLKAPLRAIEGFSRMVQEDYEDRLDEEGRRFLSVIRNSTRQMGYLIDDLLAFSKASRTQFVKVKIDMQGLVKEVFSELIQNYPGRKVEFVASDVLPACGDHAAIRQVLANLLSNALKFTLPRETAHIMFGCRPQGKETMYFIRDNGVGFDMKYSAKMFGVFQRLHTDEEFEGTGIGLAIIERIIKRHGGKVWAEGEKNKGAVIYFTLPVHQEEFD